MTLVDLGNGDLTMSRVSIAIGERSLDTVYEALDSIPFADALGNWNRVLIKINLITSKAWDTGVTTDPLVVEAIINKVRDLGKSVYVVETDAQITNASKAVVGTGMKDMLDRVGVEFINMRHEDEKVELPVIDGKTLKSFKVAKIATESALISVAKMKTLHLTDVTLGLKNMFGMLTTKWKFKYHRKDMSKVIHDIIKTLPPQLSVIDAFIALKTKGMVPTSGTIVKMNSVIASVDPVAADAVGARIFGFDPSKVKHIQWLYESGFGEIDDIEIVGGTIDELRDLVINSNK